MNVQEKYWKLMVQMKAWIFYLDIYSEESYKWDRRINVFTALVSSASIASWAIWTKYSFLWGLAIAISQVINAIKPILPFSRRIDVIGKMYPRIVDLYNEIDRKWFNVSDGSLTAVEINDLIYNYKVIYTNIENECIKNPILLKNKKIHAKADKQVEEYFTNY